MGFRFDEERLPLIVIIPEGQLTEADMEGYFQRIQEKMSKNEKIAFILDTRGLTKPPTLAQRKLLGEKLRANQAKLKENVAGGCFVISSPVFRFVLSTVFLLQSPPHPYAVFATKEEGEAWCKVQLQKFGLTIGGK